MENYLVNHAIKNVWCDPARDRRTLVKPARLTGSSGDVYGMRIALNDVRFPLEDVWFHVYQFGRVNLESLGLGESWGGWSRLDKLVNATGASFVIYDNVGLVLPSYKIWLAVLPGDNLILCAEMLDFPFSFNYDELHVRLYNNSFKRSGEMVGDQGCEVMSRVITNIGAFTDWMSKYNEWKLRPGHVICYKNGFIVNAFTMTNFKVWDHVEMRHEPLVERVLTYSVASLRSFTSILDKQLKYLIHIPKSTNKINYVDDLDIYVFQGMGDDRGKWFNSNKTAAVRQLTHGDWSLATMQLDGMVAADKTWTAANRLFIKICIKRQPRVRPIGFECSRIHELYRLSDNLIIQALAGSNVSLTEWKAASLENSPYVKLIGSSPEKLTRELVTQALGYNAISKLTGAGIQRTYQFNGQTVARLNGTIGKNFTAFEYNAEDKLIGWRQWQTGLDYYPCLNSTARKVELVEGEGSALLDIYYDSPTEMQLTEGVSYRFYLNKLESGAPTEEFFPAVKGTDYFIDASRKLFWTIDATRRRGVVWSDKRFLAYTIMTDMNDGILQFSLQHKHLADSGGQSIPLLFPMETLELWLNGNALVRDIDYFVNYPQIVITNKKFLAKDGTRYRPRIDIRCRGFAPEGAVKPKTGWVVNGLLSNNNYYDVKDDKVVRIVADGKTLDVSDVSFREDMTVAVKGLANGTPYAIYDATIPLRTLIEGDTYVLRDKARKLDAAVEGYMTGYFPTPPVSGFNPIVDRYVIFSPFMNVLVHELLAGNIRPSQPGNDTHLLTKELDAAVKRFEWLLAFEPSRMDIDYRYIEIHPIVGDSIVRLTPAQYSFVERVNTRYLFDKLNINAHIEVING